MHDGKAVNPAGGKKYAVPHQAAGGIALLKSSTDGNNKAGSYISHCFSPVFNG